MLYQFKKMLFPVKSAFLSSYSDNRSYPDFCNKASLDSKTFADFRTDKNYKKILEHLSKEQGQAYIEEARRLDPDIFKHIALFKENDRYGNPQLFDYPDMGEISPTTLRYIKVLAELVHYFGSLDGLNICEIGVGYGGQCRLINSLYKVDTYTIVDIKPALRLCQKYLDNYPLKTSLSFQTMNELKKQRYDLLISNYAFTELRREFQDVYLEKVILNASKGYITYNDVNPEGFDSYKKEDLLKKIPNSRIIAERPLTHERNCIIIWD